VARRGDVLPRLHAELAKKAPDQATDAEREALAYRQANAAVALLHLKEEQAAWPLLVHSPDPTRRSYLLHHLEPYGIESGRLLGRLDGEQDLSARRALLLALGEYLPEQLPAERREALVGRLRKLYQEDPDPGMHAASEWLLRHWGMEGRLKEIKLEPLGEGLPHAAPKRLGWYVNGQVQTFTAVPAGQDFWMGSPEGEPGRQLIEGRHRVRIPRAFALATKPVTVAQFYRFLDERKLRRQFEGGGAAELLKQYSPGPDGPMILVDWYTAALYCNWLSEQEGIPEEEWVYPKDPKQIKEGMTMPAGYLKRTGYRLAREAEWECACRAGAQTSFCYGRGERLLGKYAWYLKTSPERMQPVGLLKPNDWGLFDMHGNAYTWCQDRSALYPEAADGNAVEDKEDKDKTDAIRRVLRGSAFDLHVALVRSAYRYSLAPATRAVDVGLRPARTYH
jgi:formylglycine-generating enzyme required for sulfatase activity